MTDLAVADEAHLRLWLNPPIPRPKNLGQKSISGSCKWFVENDDFEAWLAQKDGIYWVHGYGASPRFPSRSYV